MLLAEPHRSIPKHVITIVMIVVQRLSRAALVPKDLPVLARIACHVSFWVVYMQASEKLRTYYQLGWKSAASSFASPRNAARLNSPFEFPV